MSTQLIQPPYTKVILDVEGITDAQEAIVYLGTLPIRASVQLNISNSAADVKTFKDGVLASGTLTVASYALLLEASATATIEVVDYSALTGAILTVNGTALTEGVEWTAAVNNDTTAASLELAVEAVTGISSAAVGAVITATVTTAGAAGNAFTLASSDEVNLVISGAVFTGGRDFGTVTVNGQVLTAVAAGAGANQFVAETSNDVTATNLEVAVEAVTGIQSSVTNAIVTVQAATVGTAGNSIALVVSASNGGVTRSAATLTGGIANAIDADEHTITLPAHGMSTGLKVNYDVSAGTTVDNLVNNTDYWVIRVDDDTIQLATTEENAEAGTEIEIAAADDAVGGGTFTLTPTALDLDTTISGSNDGVNWVTLPSSTDTSTSSESILFEYPTPTYAYLKVLVEPNDSEADVEVLLHTKL